MPVGPEHQVTSPELIFQHQTEGLQYGVWLRKGGVCQERQSCTELRSRLAGRPASMLSRLITMRIVPLLSGIMYAR
jgi:hypothetical protein